MPKFLQILLIAIALMAASSTFLIAQPILKKIEGAKGAPGDKIELTLRGENLLEVVRVEAVQFDEQELEVFDYQIESNEIIRIQTQIPYDAKPGRHKISVLVADTKVVRWLTPGEEGSPKTTVDSISVEQELPKFDVLYNGKLIREGEAINIDFEADENDALISKKVTIRNSSNVDLPLGDLKLPSELSLTGVFPKVIPPKQSASFRLHLKSTELDTFDKEIRFSFNDDRASPYILQIKGTTPPPPALESTMPDSLHKLSVFIDSATAWSQVGKPISLKNNWKDTLTVSDLQLPEGFTLTGSIPVQIPPGDSLIYRAELDTSLMETYDGNLEFEIANPETEPLNFQIAAKANPVPSPLIEIAAGNDTIFAGQFSTIDFDTTEVGIPVSKTFSIRNTGTSALILSNLKLPHGFRLMGPFPQNIKAGKAASYTIGLEADSAQTINDSVQFNTNIAEASLIKFPIIATIKAAMPTSEPIPTPFPWLPIAVGILATFIGTGGGYLLVKGPVRNYRMKKALGTNATFQFKPKMDNGIHHVKQSTPIMPHFEVRLKPVIDLGKQDLKFQNTLILSQSVHTEKTNATKPDDLTRIEGIGPKISAILQNAGIKTFAQLAEANPEQILQILGNEGVFGIADPSTWSEQAKLAAEADWELLVELQKELKGGRIEHESN